MNKNKYLYKMRKPLKHFFVVSGFSLIELAVVLFVLALLLGSILVPLTTQVEQRQISDTQKNMDEIRDALLGFAATNGYLPCPDRETGAGANDGVEDIAAGLCSVTAGGAPDTRAAGNLPWATLGLGREDAWGNRFRYTVLLNYARRPPAATSPFSLTTLGGLRVCPTAACATTLTATAVAVVISHGNNGRGARSAITNALKPAPPAGSDELENTDNDRDAVSRVRSNVAGVGEFDDLVVWVPKHTLHNRMISAGRLP